MNEDRAERIAASLEEQFHICRKESDIWITKIRGKDGVLQYTGLEGLLNLWRMDMEIAQVIMRVEGAKNRKSNPQ